MDFRNMAMAKFWQRPRGHIYSGINAGGHPAWSARSRRATRYAANA